MLKCKHISYLAVPAKSRKARPNRKPSAKAGKVSMEWGETVEVIPPLRQSISLPFGRPRAIDAVWFDSEKLLVSGQAGGTDQGKWTPPLR